MATTIAGADLQDLVDGIGKQLDLLAATVGATGTESTILHGMQNRIEQIKALTVEEARLHLENAAANEKNVMASFMLGINTTLARALDAHIRKTTASNQGLSDYWAAQLATRMPPSFAQMARGVGIYILGSLVFPPVTILGTFTASGSGAGSFVDGSAIDLSADVGYGSANLEGEITAAGSTTVSLVATVTGKDENGSVVIGTITFSSTAVGGKVNCVVADSRKFYDITNITIAGGAASDAFKVQSKYDRTLTL